MLHGRAQVDEAGLLEVWDDGAVFMSGPHDVVRYHDNEITVSRTQDTGGLVRMHGGALRGSSTMKKRGPRSELSPGLLGDGVVCALEMVLCMALALSSHGVGSMTPACGSYWYHIVLIELTMACCCPDGSVEHIAT